MTDEETTTKITLGEVYRSNERLASAINILTQQLKDQHHEIAQSVSVISSQQASFAVRLDNIENDMRQTSTAVTIVTASQNQMVMRVDHVDLLAKELKAKVEGLLWKAAMFSGAGGVIVFAIEMLWKH